MKLSIFNLAKKMAQKSTHRHQLGAVIVKKKKVLGLGFNQVRTHSKSNHPFHSTHSELDAILNSRLEDFTGCSIYIYREHKNGMPAMARPCPHCLRLIKSLNFKDINYSTYGDFKKEVI